MLRVVVDTNVYVSALHFGAVPDEVLEFARTGRIERPVTGPRRTTPMARRVRRALDEYY